MIASKSTLLINGNGLISNSGQLMSTDILRITGSPAISNSGQIVSDKTVDIWASNPVCITGLGAPTVLVNGQNQALKYYLLPVWNGFGVRFIMEAVEAIPVYGAAFTAIDSAMYSIIGDTDAARAKLYEMPMAFIGLGLEYKTAKLASTPFKIKEMTIATEAKPLNFELQLFGKGSSKPTSKTFGQPIETTIGGTKVKLRVDADLMEIRYKYKLVMEKVQ